MFDFDEDPETLIRMDYSTVENKTVLNSLICTRKVRVYLNKMKLFIMKN
jgi:hypothetical protein